MNKQHKHKFLFLRYSSLPAIPRFTIYECKCGKRRHRHIR